ncbi:MAG: hypothetical protein PHG69_00940 [Candidatus Omnitrophica bacterium]|nr:hypothetical protein [Candidatus Omnitrophota bacterium]
MKTFKKKPYRLSLCKHCGCACYHDVDCSGHIIEKCYECDRRQTDCKCMKH